MKTKEIDLAMKLAEAYGKIAVGHLSSDMHIFLVVNEVAPHQLSVEDLESITRLDRGTIAPIISNLVKIGYLREQGGLVSRA